MINKKHGNGKRKRSLNAKILCAPLLLLFCLGLAACQPQTERMTPRQHGDFRHYTLALTWQPGFCASGQGCLDDQPQRPLIGVHGLWASRPQSLIDARISAPQWWQKGCDYFDHSDATPALGESTIRQLDEVMPHVNGNLLTHEYDKHVQCFGFGAEEFFRTELTMRQIVADSSLGTYLSQHVGQNIRQDDLVAIFKQAFNTDKNGALQLRCENDRQGHRVLSQLWMTIRADRLDVFPNPDSWMDAPESQDNCPSSFALIGWSVTGHESMPDGQGGP
jgi:ribonuclease I